MTLIHRSETKSNRWINTTYLRTDGKEEFRERKEFGNRHAVFMKGSEWGELHHDEYNATDFPIGTVNHTAKYVEEKTGIPQELATAGIIIGAGYIGYKILKHFFETSEK